MNIHLLITVCAKIIIRCYETICLIYSHNFTALHTVLLSMLLLV